MKLTKTNVAALTVPQGKNEHIVLDDDIPGFGIRLRAGGSRTWIFQYRQGRKQRRLSFGKVKAMQLHEARAKAAKLHAEVMLGHDPAGVKVETRARAAETVEPAIRRFLDWQRPQLKPRSFGEVERHLLKHTKPLHGLQLAKVDKRSIATRLGEITHDSGPVAANRVRSSLSAFFAWCMREGLIDANPVINTNKAMENDARSRVLSNHELQLIWNALADDQYGAAIKLLALTAQRRSEIGALQWSEIDLNRRVPTKKGRSKAAPAITLPPTRTKNGREHIIPLSDPAAAIIAAQPRRATSDGDARDLVFGYRNGPLAAWASAKEALDARIAKANGGKPIAHWTLHDLRRSAATIMADRLNVTPHVIEAVLNHVGSRSGVAGTYNRAHYEHDVRIALDRWADHLLAVAEGRASTVVNLPLTA